MADKQPFTEQEKADLVAFLDGELTGEAARALETRLSLDPGARAEADSLKRTWELLDFLPKPEPSPTFTNRTLEKLAPIRSVHKAPAGRRAWRPWFVGAGWAAAALAAAAAGYGLVAWTGAPPANPDQDLVRDLRVIENKRYYDRVDDLEFLKQLDQPDLFGDETSGS
jgi:anti-sigma factor RsiW